MSVWSAFKKRQNGWTDHPHIFFVATPHNSFQKRVMIFWKKLALMTFNNSIILTEVLRKLLYITKKRGDSNKILKLKIVTGKEVPIEHSNKNICKWISKTKPISCLYIKYRRQNDLTSWPQIVLANSHKNRECFLYNCKILRRKMPIKNIFGNSLM